MNFVTLADENLKSFGEYPFLIFEDVIFTNRQMINDTNGIANGLKKLGVNKGDKVVVMLPNCPEVLISYQGILRCGAVIVPIIPLMNERELSHILGNCEAVAMITTRDIFQKNELSWCPCHVHNDVEQSRCGKVRAILMEELPQRCSAFSGRESVSISKEISLYSL